MIGDIGGTNARFQVWEVENKSNPGSAKRAFEKVKSARSRLDLPIFLRPLGPSWCYNYVFGTPNCRELAIIFIPNTNVVPGGNQTYPTKNHATFEDAMSTLLKVL